MVGAPAPNYLGCGHDSTSRTKPPLPARNACPGAHQEPAARANWGSSPGQGVHLGAHANRLDSRPRFSDQNFTWWGAWPWCPRRCSGTHPTSTASYRRDLIPDQSQGPREGHAQAFFQSSSCLPPATIRPGPLCTPRGKTPGLRFQFEGRELGLPSLPQRPLWAAVFDPQPRKP